MTSSSSDIQKEIDTNVLEQTALLEQMRQVKKEWKSDFSNDMLKLKLSLLSHQYDQYNEIIKELEEKIKKGFE